MQSCDTKYQEPAAQTNNPATLSTKSLRHKQTAPLASTWQRQNFYAPCTAPGISALHERPAQAPCTSALPCTARTNNQGPRGWSRGGLTA